MVKLACMTLPYMHLPFERALEGIARAGYRYVSFGLPHAGKPEPDEADRADPVRMRDTLERFGLKPVMLVSTGQLAPGEPLERARRRFEFAQALGIDELLSLGTWGYRTFPHEPLPAGEMQAKDEAFTDKFRQVAALAETFGITVTLKPHTGNTASAVQLRRTLEQIGSTFVKISYDPGNVQFYEGLDSAADMSAVLPDICSFIAKDHRGARANADFPIPGEGDVPFERLFAKLREAAFSGPVVVERLDGTDTEPAHPARIDERIRTARVRLEELLLRAGLPVEY